MASYPATVYLTLTDLTLLPQPWAHTTLALYIPSFYRNCNPWGQGCYKSSCNYPTQCPDHSDQWPGPHRMHIYHTSDHRWPQRLGADIWRQQAIPTPVTILNYSPVTEKREVDTSGDLELGHLIRMWACVWKPALRKREFIKIHLKK